MLNVWQMIFFCLQEQGLSIIRNPLGTAAGFGTTLPINRKLTSELLEFDDLLYNSAYASLSRGKS